MISTIVFIFPISIAVSGFRKSDLKEITLHDHNRSSTNHSTSYLYLRQGPEIELWVQDRRDPSLKTHQDSSIPWKNHKSYKDGWNNHYYDREGPHPTKPTDHFKEPEYKDCAQHNCEERGTATTLLDLNGYIREKFAFAAAIADTGTSVICSPFSTLTPLGMLILGADNDRTVEELVRAIGISSKQKASSHFKNLRREMRNIPGVDLYLCSMIYVDRTKKVKGSYCSAAESTFGTCIGTVDMGNEVAAANSINDWVSKNTNNLIHNMVRPSDISPHTSVMIIDALVFQGSWKHKFDGYRTATFHGPGRSSVNMMYKDTKYQYGSSDALGAQAIVIPYKGDAASMIVLLPHRKDGLDLLLTQLKLAPDLINKIKMEKTFVRLRLPKFEISSDLDLKVLYEKVGINEINRDGTGMNAIIDGEVIKIDKGIHRAVISVDKEGTTATASSFVQVAGYGSSHDDRNAVDFVADHPFLFFITAHREQLLAGTFVGPSSGENYFGAANPMEFSNS